MKAATSQTMVAEARVAGPVGRQRGCGGVGGTEVPSVGLKCVHTRGYQGQGRATAAGHHLSFAPTLVSVTPLGLCRLDSLAPPPPSYRQGSSETSRGGGGVLMGGDACVLGVSI